MTQLSIGLLGGFRVQLGSGPPLTIRRKKARALLAYLALRPGVAHSRESLAGLLWSETTDEHARHNLRQTLFALRQALGAAPAPFTLEGETVRLHGPTVAVDAAAFERCVHRGTRDALDEAAALYRGELLEGFTVGESPFDDWVAAERQRLRGLALAGLDKLLALEVVVGDPERAVTTTLRLLALDPARESAHRTLMDLYARQGRRTSALRQYQRCVDALRRELGVRPEAACCSRRRIPSAPPGSS
ncbi:MAG TPA: BTAD domain-containing putative transcriptional regulator [Methylomirabilota bacterium]